MNLLRMKLVMSLVSLALPVIVAGPAHALYKCVDEKGVTHYGDTMPPQCAKKPVVEMSRQGNVVRKIDAPLTPEQLKAMEDDRIRNKEKNDRMAVQKLRDNALMSTYGAEREFDVAQAKDIANLDMRRKTLQARTEDVDKNLTKLNNEMEFYRAGKSKSSKTKEAPPQLAQDQKRAVRDAESLRSEIKKIDSDKEEINARYESEKSRWKRLKDGLPAGTLLDDKGSVEHTPELRSQIVGQSQLIAGRPRGISSCEGKTYECTLGVIYLCRGANVGGPGINQLAVKCTADKR